MFRQQKNIFKKDNIVTKGTPKRLSGLEIVDMLDKLMPDLGISNVTNILTIGLINVDYMGAHNMYDIDVTHQEHNMYDSIISTCMSLLGKTKDNTKAYVRQFWAYLRQFWSS
jgi:hypothetical protein